MLNGFYEKMYFKYGKIRFLVGFSIIFSILVNIVANLVIVLLFRREIELIRAVVYTIGYILPGCSVGIMRINKIEGKQ